MRERARKRGSPRPTGAGEGASPTAPECGHAPADKNAPSDVSVANSEGHHPPEAKRSPARRGGARPEGEARRKRGRARRGGDPPSPQARGGGPRAQDAEDNGAPSAKSASCPSTGSNKARGSAQQAKCRKATLLPVTAKARGSGAKTQKSREHTGERVAQQRSTPR